MRKLLLIIATVFALAGCANLLEKEVKDVSDKGHQEKVSQQVEISITQNNGKNQLTKKVVEFKEGETLMQAMEKNFSIETAYNGQFIVGVDGTIANEKEKESWFFSINGENAMVGASEYKLQSGDAITFDLHKWE